MTENRTVLAERTAERTRPIDTDVATLAKVQPSKTSTDAPGTSDGSRTPQGPRRWNEGDERLMLYGLLFFLGLGLYAAAFVVFGMWLPP